MTQLDPIYGIQSLLARLKISNILLTALIDSGAVISVIRESTLARMDSFFGCLESSDIQAASVNGVPLCFVGKTRLLCEWFHGSEKFVGTFYVAVDINVPVILGMDLQHQQKCKLDFFLSQLDVNEGILECISLSTTTSSGPNGSSVYVVNTTMLPQRSESLVLCKPTSQPVSIQTQPVLLGSTSCNGFIGLIEPLQNHNEMYLIASAIVTVPKDRENYIRILNPTKSNITLYSKQKVAVLSEAPTNCVVSSVNLPDEDVQPSLDKFLAEDLQKLNNEERQAAEKLLEQYSHVFARDKWDLGRCGLHKLQIKLKEDAQPSGVPYRAINPTKRKALKEFVNNLLTKDLIEPTHSEWAAPTVLVPKKDGSYRLVIDYRKLNSQTVKTSWPLPRIQDILGSLQGCCCFSNLDIATGFHQMETEEDPHLTSFITPFGLYQWKRMPMGLCNAYGAFQRLMELVLTGLTYEILLVYIDGIIVYGRTFEEHLKNLAITLGRIEEANLKISPSKCKLFHNSIRFLGQVTSKGGIQTDPSKIAAVNSYPLTKTVKKVHAFLGLTGFYRKFIPSFGKIAQPLYNLMNEENDSIERRVAVKLFSL